MEVKIFTKSEKDLNSCELSSLPEWWWTAATVQLKAIIIAMLLHTVSRGLD